jgi:hypothetical protein
MSHALSSRRVSRSRRNKYRINTKLNDFHPKKPTVRLQPTGKGMKNVAKSQHPHILPVENRVLAHQNLVSDLRFCKAYEMHLMRDLAEIIVGYAGIVRTLVVTSIACKNCKRTSCFQATVDAKFDCDVPDGYRIVDTSKNIWQLPASSIVVDVYHLRRWPYDRDLRRP